MKVIRVCALIVLVFFFFPFFTVSCGSMTLDISGYDIGKGVENYSEGNAGIFFIIVLAIILALVSLAARSRIRAYISTTISALGLLLMLIVYNATVGELKKLGYGGLELSDLFDIRYGFCGCVLAYGTATLASIFDIISTKEK